MHECPEMDRKSVAEICLAHVFRHVVTTRWFGIVVGAFEKSQIQRPGERWRWWQSRCGKSHQSRVAQSSDVHTTGGHHHWWYVHVGVGGVVGVGVGGVVGVVGGVGVVGVVVSCSFCNLSTNPHYTTVWETLALVLIQKTFFVLVLRFYGSTASQAATVRGVVLG
jgi:hypothetical protein